LALLTEAASRTPASAEDPLAVDYDKYAQDMDVNTNSVFTAAREAVAAFGKTSGGGTFIFTGNKLNIVDIPGMLVFGTGKAGAAKIMQGASHAYGGKGYK
jgi:NAD(P)-dependent dehydrogenase (short-subunit alcohol dehydrogenase family)